jgi:tetratricopeptide (TPR) repeat protein
MTSREACSFSIFADPMPETAKILPFPQRNTHSVRTSQEAAERASDFLGTDRADRSIAATAAALGDGDVLTAVLAQLWQLINSEPVRVADEASAVYSWLAASDARLFFFDEREYFMGESALLAGGASRHIGRRSEAETWFDRADAGFRHTIAPAAHLARVSYNRLALRYDMNRHEDVIELLPSTARTFEQLGMRNDLAKCALLEALSLRVVGRCDDAATKLEALIADPTTEVKLKGLALVNLGGLRSTAGDFEAALEAYRDARNCIANGEPNATTADLKMLFGETLRSMGRLSDAIAAYREAIGDLVELGMATRVAYFRVALAAALLEAEMPREAEWEILAALPTIDEQKMVPEGLAALELLRESVRQRKTNSTALLELRQYLQAKN